ERNRTHEVCNERERWREHDVFKIQWPSNCTRIAREHLCTRPRAGTPPHAPARTRAPDMDTIFISDFRLEMLIGVYDWERRVPQTVQLDLEIGLPAREKRSDRIGDTIDYSKVVARIERSVADNRFLLVEAFAE